MFKRILAIFGCGILIAVAMLPAVKARAFSSGDFGSDDFPPLNRSSISLLQAIKPGDITLEMVNRNVIKVNVAGIPLASDANKTYDSLFGGNYIDANSDGTWQYKRDGNPMSAALHGFDDSDKTNSDVGDPFHLGSVNTANVKSFRITLAFSIKGDSGDPPGFMYLDKDFKWQEISNGPGNRNVNAILDTIFNDKMLPQISVSKPENFNIIGRYNVDQKSITSYETSDQRSFVYCLGTNNEISFRLNACDNNKDDYLQYSGDLDALAKSTAPVSMTFAKSKKTIQVDGGASTVTDPTGGASGTGQGKSCQSAISDAFGWLLCPILGGIDKFVGAAETFVNNRLSVDLGNDAERQPLKNVWLQMARISSSILLITGLVMVISTALGFGVFEAYTVKKILPRLVIATVGIWISWPLITAYVGFINDVGQGISALMLSQFDNAKAFTLQSIIATAGSSASTGGQGIFTGALLGGAGAALISAGPYGILTLAVTALGAFTIAIVILTIRQVLIILLIVTAPLGIAAWIFPNMKRTWELWSDTLNTLLLMYPFIMALFAAGKITAYILARSNKEHGFFQLAMSLIAYLMALILLPFVFKATSGVLGKLTGMVNNRSKGVFDRARNSIQDRKNRSGREIAKRTKKSISDQQAALRYSQGLQAGGVRGLYRRQRAGGFVGGKNVRNQALEYAQQQVTADVEKQLARENAGYVSGFLAHSGNVNDYLAANPPKGTPAEAKAEESIIRSTFDKFNKAGYKDNAVFAVAAANTLAQSGSYSEEAATRATNIYTKNGTDAAAAARWKPIDDNAKRTSRKNGSYYAQDFEKGKVDLSTISKFSFDKMFDDMSNRANTMAFSTTVNPTHAYTYKDQAGNLVNLSMAKSSDMATEDMAVQLAKIKAGDTSIPAEKRAEFDAKLAAMRLPTAGAEQNAMANHIETVSNERAARKFYNLG